MKKLLLSLCSAVSVFMAGCSTTEKTTTYYKEDGKTVDRVVYEVSEISDVNSIGSYLRDVDEDKAGDRSGNLSKLSFGYGDIGLSFFSVNLNSTRAPAKAAASDKVLDSVAKVKAAGKTTVQTESVGVNTDAKAKETLEKAESE